MALLSAGPSVLAEDGILPFTRATYGPWNASQLASAGFDARYRHSDWNGKGVDRGNFLDPKR